MHELTLSEGIVRTVLATPGVGKDNLRAVSLKVGALSNVSVSALEFCMQLVLEQQGLEAVGVRIEEVPARLRCACGRRYTAGSLFEPCPACGGTARDVVEGRDVTIESAEVEDGQD